jgi:hypothetical protein
MKWVPSEPVGWLEADYDDLVWDYVHDDEIADGETGLTVTHTVHRVPPESEPHIVSRSYSQPLFWFKDASEAGPAVEVGAHTNLWCNDCADGLHHRCGRCMTVITCMEGTLCAACWSRPREGDESGLPAVALPELTSEELARYANLPGVRALVDALMRDATLSPDETVRRVGELPLFE